MMRLVGRVLVPAGAVLAVAGAVLLGLAMELGRGLCEGDDCPRGGGGLGSLVETLMWMGLAALPGVLLLAAGWMLLRRDGVGLGPAAPVVATLAAVTVVGWMGFAYAIDDPFPPADRPPGVVPPAVERVVGSPWRRAQDARRHPVPPQVLRAEERRVQRSLTRNGLVEPVEVTCARIWEWTVGCHVTTATAEWWDTGRYVSRSRTVLPGETVEVD